MDQREIEAKFPVLLGAIEEAIPEFEKLPQVVKGCVSIYGESLGGFLASAVATHDQDVSAVSEYGGGMPQGYTFTHQPPHFLIQHGQNDSLVPVREAYALADLVRANSGSAGLVIYPAEDHYFSKLVREEVFQNSEAFFMKNRCEAGHPPEF